jgi:hypothetical protein
VILGALHLNGRLVADCLPRGLAEEVRRRPVEPGHLLGPNAGHVQLAGWRLAPYVRAYVREHPAQVVQRLAQVQLDPDLLDVRPQGLPAFVGPDL